MLTPEQLDSIEALHKYMITNRITPTEVAVNHTDLIPKYAEQMCILAGPEAVLPFMKRLVNNIEEQSDLLKEMYESYKAIVSLDLDLVKIPTFKETQ